MLFFVLKWFYDFYLLLQICLLSYIYIYIRKFRGNQWLEANHLQDSVFICPNLNEFVNGLQTNHQKDTTNYLVFSFFSVE